MKIFRKRAQRYQYNASIDAILSSSNYPVYLTSAFPAETLIGKFSDPLRERANVFKNNSRNNERQSGRKYFSCFSLRSLFFFCPSLSFLYIPFYFIPGITIHGADELSRIRSISYSPGNARIPVCRFFRAISRENRERIRWKKAKSREDNPVEICLPPSQLWKNLPRLDSIRYHPRISCFIPLSISRHFSKVFSLKRNLLASRILISRITQEFRTILFCKQLW